MSCLLEVTVSYDNKDETFSVGIRPGLELSDHEVGLAYESLWQDVRSFFHLPVDARATLYEAESNRIMSKETFRDPFCIPKFPKYWFMRVENGYSNPQPGPLFFESEPPGDDTYPSLDYSDLELLQYSPPDGEYNDDDDNDGIGDNYNDLYPSLAELSMGGSPLLDDSADDLTTATLTCDEEGRYGLVLRHFTVIANIPHSDNSDSEGGCSGSVDSYDVLRMSTLFVMSVDKGGPADIQGIQPGDIVNAINGNRILGGNTTEDILILLDESERSLVLGLSPEKHDDLLFLYPQYVNGKAGDFISSSNEKITIINIPVLAPSPDSHAPSSRTTRPRRLRPSSADATLLHRVDSDSYLLDSTYTHVLDTGSPLQDGSSINSLSSEPLNSLNDDDLLLDCDLSEIPVIDQSPQVQRHTNIPSNGFTNDSSLSGNEPMWFPYAEDRRNFDSYSYPEPGRVHIPEPEHVLFKDKHGGSHKLAQRLKGMFQNLTGSSPSTHRKVHKTSSASTIQTSSTSALDRMKVGLTPPTHSLQYQRSKSTDLGRIKIKKDGQYSLEALTKVNSAENLMIPSINGRGYPLQKHHSDENTHKISRNNSLDVPAYDEETSLDKGDPSYGSTTGSSQGLAPDLGKNLSLDSGAGSQTRLSGSGGRSYRTQRKKLHQAAPRISTKDTLTTPTIITPTRRTSIDESHKNLAGRHGYQPHRPTRSSAYSRSDAGSTRWSQGGRQDSIDDNLEMPSAFYDPQTPPMRSHDTLALPGESHDSRVLPKELNVPDGSTGQTFANERSTFVASIDTVSSPPHQAHNYHRPRSAVVASKMPARRAMSEQPSLPDYNEVVRNRASINDPRIVGEMHPARSRNRLVKKEPGKFNSVFHGPIHKKQEKDNGGRKPSDRSWFSVYAAIEGHFMVFYNSVQDALTGQPLSTEPSLNLHRCTVTPLPNKSKKHVFRLGFSNGVECLIQAENEEAMMRWMRIIHNLNRSRTRMGPVPQQRSSTQEDPKIKKVEKRKIRRMYTPQPPKHKSTDSRDDSSKLFEKFKRTVQKNRRPKDSVDMGDLPVYRSFEMPLEDCPASYDDKSIPLLLMMCVKKLESKWLDTEGLYRVAGGITQIRDLAAKINRGKFKLIEECCDPNVITSIVKKFLKELPDALIPNTHYDAFIACAKDPEIDARPRKLKILTDDLPLAHRHVLAFLVRHLNNVEAHKAENKMSQKNLSIVFGPTVVRKEDSTGLVSDMNATYTIMEILMTNVDSFFPDIAPHSISNGTLSPSEQSAMSQGAALNRRSWDISSSRNVLSLTGGDLTSEHPFSMSTEFFNSQEPRMSHKKSRISRSRKLLSSHLEESTSSGGHTSSEKYMSPPPPSRSVADMERGKRERKISYGMAMTEGSIPLSNSGHNLDDDAPFTHQSLMPSPGGILSPTRQIRSITSPPINYIPRMSMPEIVGPSSNLLWREDDGESRYRPAMSPTNKRSEV